MSTQTHTRPVFAQAERRTNQALRERFDAACKLLQPVLGHPGSHNGTALYRAMNQLHAAHPELSGSEIEALVAAVLRSLQQRGGTAQAA